ncbi:YitT family protein [Fructobacillus sp. M1-13]|uniref:YitT family protein n=1 Tax=Fructobacillus papyriferae TaxID=2713171 RepID=A0ABS5QNE4_9LACO|nr:YitT family protein [Fructobacillus papyriferae]MBS9334633.1 YitT family protein [Fructobacillus papyriferae]MCD2158623.1 YitT family protein [Fructobacillus papyriferae]
MIARIGKKLDHYYYHQFVGAAFYGVVLGIAMNYFWQPGHIYSSGFNGLAQLIDTLTGGRFPVAWGIACANLPLLLLAWLTLSKRFAIFTAMAVVLSAIFVPLFATKTVLTSDPLMCAIFGGGLNGMAVGTALRCGLGTGGLDIIGMILKQHFRTKVGSVNLAFNALIMIGAGLTYGWQYALYSIIGVVVSAHFIDVFYTHQQQIQEMIVTNKPEMMCEHIQQKMRRGVTIIDSAHGGYTGKDKSVLLTVVTQHELGDLREAIKEVDPQAFYSESKVEHTGGRFFEPEP